MKPDAFVHCLEWALFVSLLSHHTFASTEPELVGWARNDNDSFPIIKDDNKEYYFGQVYSKSGQEHNIFRQDVFDEKNGLSDIRMKFKLWLHKNTTVLEKNTALILKSETNEFLDRQLTGSAKALREYALISSQDFSYAISDLSARYVQEKTFDGKFGTENEVLFKSIYLNESSSVTLKKMKINPDSIHDGMEPENVQRLEHIILKLYLNLGEGPDEGLIFLDTWKIGETKYFRIDDYINLNTVTTYLKITATPQDKDLIDRIMKPLEHDTNRFSGYNTKIEAPIGKVEEQTWYYYNPIYDYSIEHDNDFDSGKQVHMSVCDVAANCFPFDFTVGEPSFLHPNTKKFLANTPFIRFVLDHSINGVLNFSPTHFHDLILNNGTFVKSILDSMKLLSQNKPINITLPASKLDLRFLSLRIKLKCNQKVQLSKLSIGLESVDLSFNPATFEPEFNTRDYIFSEDTTVRKWDDLIITLETDSTTEIVCQVIDKTPDLGLGHSFYDYNTNYKYSLDNQSNRTNVIKPGKNYFSSEWIKRKEFLPLDDSSMEFLLILEPTHKLYLGDIVVKRTIFGNNYFRVFDISDKIRFDEIRDKQVITLKDSDIDYPGVMIGSYVKIGYSIRTPESEPAQSFYADSLTINFSEDREEKKRNCFPNSLKKIDCQYQNSKCYRTFEEKNKTCIMKKYYENHVEKCEKGSCSNLLTQPMSKSSITSNIPTPNRYYPLNFAADEQKSFLGFGVNTMSDKDYCMTINYRAKNGTFNVKLFGTQSVIVLKQSDSIQYKEICLSRYTPYPHKVTSLLFEFVDEHNQVIENLDDHWIEVAQVRFDKALKDEDYQISSVGQDHSEVGFFEADALAYFSGQKTLTTKWIKNRDNKLRYQLNVTTNDNTPVNYSAHLIDDKLTSYQIDVWSFIGIHNFRMNPTSQSYKIQFEFQTGSNHTLAKLETFVLNDPSIE